MNKLPSFFIDNLAAWGDAPALVGVDGASLSYAQLSARIDGVCEALGAPRAPGGLLLIEASNELEPLVAYLAALRSRTPVMLCPAGRTDPADSVLSTYRPAQVFARGEDGWQLRVIEDTSPPAVHPDLAVLLSTSGSTGTAKFVRLSRTNLEANARSIVEYLGIVASDCAATTLPFHYSYGLSVIHSHLSVGASILLTDASVVAPEFWAACRQYGVTSFAAVPYTFELLERVGFADTELPSLRTITQAGGRLAPERVRQFHELGQRRGWQLFVMYGQTEATARMSYVPPAKLSQHVGDIGIAIPGGELRIVDEHGEDIEGAGIPGELVYRGPNVMMGYADKAEDLALGAQWQELRTGDLAQRDAEGFYSIVGRLKRFIKVFGLRVGLDEVEKKLAAAGFRAVATGTDEALVVATLDAGSADAIQRMLCDWSKLPATVVSVLELEEYPLLPSGKVDYGALKKAAPSASASAPASKSAPGACLDIRRLYSDATRGGPVGPQDTFVTLGGDSMSFVSVSMSIEEALGYVPGGWENLTVAQLEALEHRGGPLREVETSIVLRALAIVMIVCNHFEVFQIHELPYPRGAATLLLGVAGYNFAKFQLSTCARGGPAPLVHSAARLWLMTVMFMVPVQLITGKFSWPTILMYSNFIDPGLNFGMAPWFIQVLLQVLVLLAVILSLPALRRVVDRAPYASCATLLAVSIASFAVGPRLWDTDPLFHRTPHMLLYCFVLGCCIHLGRSAGHRLAHSVLILALLAVQATHFTWLTAGCLLLLVWTQHVWLVWPLHRMVGGLASASLFIYLSHGDFRKLVDERLHVESLGIQVVAALVGGYVLWAVIDRALTLAASLRSRHAMAPRGSGDLV